MRLFKVTIVAIGLFFFVSVIATTLAVLFPLFPKTFATIALGVMAVIVFVVANDLIEAR